MLVTSRRSQEKRGRNVMEQVYRALLQPCCGSCFFFFFFFCFVFFFVVVVLKQTRVKSVALTTTKIAVSTWMDDRFA